MELKSFHSPVSVCSMFCISSNVFFCFISKLPLQRPQDLNESELITLAGKISGPDMQGIAVKKLHFTFSDVKSLLAVYRENHIMMNFEVLNRWKNMNSINSRQVDLYSPYKHNLLKKYNKYCFNLNSSEQRQNI